eukprot:COSAG02_NODE_424_length_22575_cov_79.088361_2_plen_111_part_00
MAEWDVESVPLQAVVLTLSGAPELRYFVRYSGFPDSASGAILNRLGLEVAANKHTGRHIATAVDGQGAEVLHLFARRLKHRPHFCLHLSCLGLVVAVLQRHDSAIAQVDW